MAWQSGGQYGDFQFQNSNLSPIVEAALQRRKQQQQMNAQMIANIGKVAAKYGQNPEPSTPGQGDVSQPGYYTGGTGQQTDKNYPTDANIQTAQYGPGLGENYHDARYGAFGDNTLHQGSAALSPDLAKRWGLKPGDTFSYGGRTGTFDDYSYRHPGDPNNNTVEWWIGNPDAPSGYAQGGVIPLPDNAEGVLGWRTMPDPDSRADMGLKPENPIKQAMPQKFAGGGVASWSDPYENRKNQYVEQLGHMADVSGIAGVIAHQRMFQQQQNQENIQNAMKSATEYLKQQQTDQIGQYLNLAQQAQDSGTPGGESQAMADLRQHMSPSSLYKSQQVISQNQSDEADAQRQATNDYWLNLDRQRQINKDMGLDAYGGKLPAGTVTQNGKEWAQAPDGTWHMVTGNVAFNAAQGPDTPNAQQAFQNITGVKTTDLPTAASSLNAYQPGKTPFPSVGAYTQGNDTPGPTKDKILSAFNEYQTGKATPSNPPAVTGIAPSYEAAQIGQHFRAPDGSIRLKQN